MTAQGVGAAAARPGSAWAARDDLLAVLAGLFAICLWDVSGLDLPLTRWFGTAGGFPWRDQWVMSALLHDSAKYPAWLVFGLLLVGVWMPLPFARKLARPERVWWLVTTLGCVVLIPLLRRESATSCPWSLVEFGGHVARYVPHWHLFQRDGGPGRCFPSGHASTAFSFLAGWFALRGRAPRAAKAWLLVTVAVGLLFGWVQVMRGAHYLSHSLWTAWICWATTALSFHLARLPFAQRVQPDNRSVTAAS
jgi:membrane-associated PAP2 superfamily phosphatase